MTYLSKDDILKADDLPARDVDVPEWGGTVRVRGLTGAERDRYDFVLAAVKDDPSKAQFRADLVGRCMVDEDGKRLFSDSEVTKLAAKSGAALDRIFDVVRELSGMGKGATDKAAADFGDAPSDGSHSG